MDKFLSEKARPAEPPAPYIGGKRQLARRLIDIIGQTEHQTYVEPFVGMGGVFLRRPVEAKAEVINDISGDVANLFRILQRHYPQFMEVMRFQLTSRREFERLRRCEPSTLTDLERAARFLYLQRLAFGGKVAGRTFGVDPLKAGRFNILKLATQLEDIHERLAGVVIENLDWRTVIARYDKPTTLFFLDPPYWGVEDYYGDGVFGREDFKGLAETLRNLSGRFILTLNDVAEIRDLFSWADISAVSLNYTAGGKAVAAKEIIIRSPKR